MKFWDDIRNYFYRKNLTNRLLQSFISRSVINLGDSKTIGIIYDSSNPENDKIVARFADGLRAEGRIVDILGFVTDKKIESKEGITIFNVKSLTWFRVPKDEKVEKFAEKKFDLLFAGFIGENLPLEYIAQISKARWRVGAYREGKTDNYDMMVNVGEKNELQYLLDQGVYFLKQIKYDSK